MSRLRSLRRARGWSQTELASVAQIPRATISGIERGHATPSVVTALALAGALETTVEALFGPATPRWATAPASRGFAARVDDQLLLYGASDLARPPGLCDYTGHDLDPALPEARRTLVIATCDPVAPVLAELLQTRGVRLLTLTATSTQAIRLLDSGQVHAAGVHLSSDAARTANDALARTAQQPMLRIAAASWEMGLVHRPEADRTTMKKLLGPNSRLVSRPRGSGARACLDRLRSEHAKTKRFATKEVEARDHAAVATIVAAGFATAGIAVRPLADAHGLSFRPVERSRYDVFVRADSDDRRVQTLREVIESHRYREAIETYAGIEACRD